jgi:integrase
VQAAQRLERGKNWTDREGYVFTHEAAYADGETRFGVPVRPDWMGTAFRALVAEAGLPVIRLHDLRHTWATLAFQAKQHPKTVADQLGHATVSVTLDIYSHAVPGLQAEAVGRVAKLALAKR